MALVIEVLKYLTGGKSKDFFFFWGGVKRKREAKPPALNVFTTE